VIHAAVRACRRGFGIEPVLLRSGGTIPVVELFVHRLRLPVALLGLALPDDGMHAPNERTHLPTLQQGVETLVWFLDELARMPAVAGRAPAPALEDASGGAGSR
jgi:acetylornithine deacetylase/succinyl-diaminopimelate desuccinylase-like protein